MKVTPTIPDLTPSQEAHESIKPQKQFICDRVMESIKARHSQGMTCDEVEIALGLTHQTASARVNELMKKKLIIDSTLRRKTRSGRKATVWICPVATWQF
jgi:predicted transcriptional regulator